MLINLGRITFEEKIVGLVFLVTATLWMTRKIIIQLPGLEFLDDAVIAMIGGISLFLFKSKSKDKKLLLWSDMEKSFPWGLIFLFGGGMALAFVVNNSGLATWLASLIPTDTSIIIVLFTLVIMIVFLTELTSNLATTMTFIPIVYAIGINLNINPLILTIPLTISASCAFMLPVATPPNSIVYASNLIPIQTMVKAGFWLNIISIFVVVGVANFMIPNFL
jgi:sodium-dependent dicarboxylate transporter 2/3/5